MTRKHLDVLLWLLLIVITSVAAFGFVRQRKTDAFLLQEQALRLEIKNQQTLLNKLEAEIQNCERKLEIAKIPVNVDVDAYLNRISEMELDLQKKEIDLQSGLEDLKQLEQKLKALQAERLRFVSRYW